MILMLDERYLKTEKVNAWLNIFKLDCDTKMMRNLDLNQVE